MARRSAARFDPNKRAAARRSGARAGERIRYRVASPSQVRPPGTVPDPTHKRDEKKAEYALKLRPTFALRLPLNTNGWYR